MFFFLLKICVTARALNYGRTGIGQFSRDVYSLHVRLKIILSHLTIFIIFFSKIFLFVLKQFLSLDIFQNIFIYSGGTYFSWNILFCFGKNSIFISLTKLCDGIASSHTCDQQTLPIFWSNWVAPNLIPIIPWGHEPMSSTFWSCLVSLSHLSHTIFYKRISHA